MVKIDALVVIFIEAISDFCLQTNGFQYNDCDSEVSSKKHRHKIKCVIDLPITVSILNVPCMAEQIPRTPMHLLYVCILTCVCCCS